MNSEFNVAIHCLLFLNSKRGLANSEQIACSVSTHPARVRKVLSLLRKQGYVHTKEGVGGGYLLNMELQEITLGDLYRLFARGSLHPGWCSGSEQSPCLISSNIHSVMDEIYNGAEDQLEQYFDTILLSELSGSIYEKGSEGRVNCLSLEQLSFYVGSYAAEEEAGIHLCLLNLSTGELRLLGSTSGIENPSFLTLNRNATRLYAVRETSEGTVVCYDVNPADGKLTLLSEESTEGAHPCYVAVSNDLLLTANYSSGLVNSYALDENGVLAGMISKAQHTGQGPRSDRQEAAHAHSIVPDPSGHYAYASDLGTDEIVIYRIQDKKLSDCGKITLPPGAGPRHFAIHPNKLYAYGINELNNTITVYSYEEQQGRLEIIGEIGTLPDEFAGENLAADIHISGDGRYVYGSNRGHNSIVRFVVDAESGQLTSPLWTETGGDWPRNFALLDEYVLVANQYSNNITVLRRDPSTGELEITGQELAISKPTCIGIVNRG